jgi:hypothetical protein
LAPIPPDESSEDLFRFELIASVASDQLLVGFAVVLVVIIERDSFLIIRVKVGTRRMRNPLLDEMRSKELRSARA